MASKSTVSIDANKKVRIQPRPEASKEIRDLFSEIVEAKPVEHFRPGDGPLLELYCQSILLSRKAYASMMDEGLTINGKVNLAVVAYEKANKSAAALAARLRVAPQLRFDRNVAGKPDRPSDVLSRLNDFEDESRVSQ